MNLEEHDEQIRNILPPTLKINNFRKLKTEKILPFKNFVKKLIEHDVLPLGIFFECGIFSLVLVNSENETINNGSNLQNVTNDVNEVSQNEPNNSQYDNFINFGDCSNEQNLFLFETEYVPSNFFCTQIQQQVPFSEVIASENINNNFVIDTDLNVINNVTSNEETPKKKRKRSSSILITRSRSHLFDDILFQYNQLPQNLDEKTKKIQINKIRQNFVKRAGKHANELKKFCDEKNINFTETMILASEESKEKLFSKKNFSKEEVDVLQSILKRNVDGMNWAFSINDKEKFKSNYFFYHEFCLVSNQKLQYLHNLLHNTLKIELIPLNFFTSFKKKMDSEIEIKFKIDQELIDNNFICLDPEIALNHFVHSYKEIFNVDKYDLDYLVFKMDARMVSWAAHEMIWTMNVISDKISFEHYPILLGIAEEKEEQFIKNEKETEKVEKTLDKIREKYPNKLKSCLDLGASQDMGVSSMEHPCPICYAFNKTKKDQVCDCGKCNNISIRDRKNFDKFSEILRDPNEKIFLNFLRKDFVVCLLHGILRILKLVIVRIPKDNDSAKMVLQNRIQQFFPKFHFVFDYQTNTHEASGIDSNACYKILLILDEILSLNKRLIPGYNLQSQKNLLNVIKSLQKFLKFLKIHYSEEIFLKKYNLWDNYVSLMENLGKDLHNQFNLVFNPEIRTSWYIHVLTVHIGYILKNFGSLNKWSTQNIEKMHEVHRRKYKNGIQKGKKFATIQKKIFFKDIRVFYNLSNYNNLRRRYHKIENNARTKKRYDIFLEILKEIQCTDSFLNEKKKEIFNVIHEKKQNVSF